jgi:hypothetical protein
MGSPYLVYIGSEVLAMSGRKALKPFHRATMNGLNANSGSDAARVFPSAALLAPTDAPLSAGSGTNAKGAIHGTQHPE